MSLDMQSVSVEAIPEFDNLLLMKWESIPVIDDVTVAFQTIDVHLKTTEAPIDVVVDIRSNPVFPLHVTVNQAIRVNRHEKLGRWLVIGANRSARFIGKMVTSFGKRNIEWFESEDEVFAYLNSEQRNS